jgi:hypothetical protein
MSHHVPGSMQGGFRIKVRRCHLFRELSRLKKTNAVAGNVRVGAPTIHHAHFLNLASPAALGMTITLWSIKATIKDDEW